MQESADFLRTFLMKHISEITHLVIYGDTMLLLIFKAGGGGRWKNTSFSCTPKILIQNNLQ